METAGLPPAPYITPHTGDYTLLFAALRLFSRSRGLL